MTNFRTLHKCLTLFDQFFSVYGTLLLSEGERIEREKINWTAVIVLRNAEATVSGSEAAAVVLKVMLDKYGSMSAASSRDKGRDSS